MEQSGGDILDFARLLREIQFPEQANIIDMSKQGAEYNPDRWWENQRNAVSNGEKSFFGERSEITGNRVTAVGAERDNSADYRARDWSAHGYDFIPADAALHKEFNSRVTPEMTEHEDFRGVFSTFFSRYANALEERSPGKSSIQETEYENIMQELVIAVRALTQKMVRTVEYSR
jgi:hypothetical protein